MPPPKPPDTVYTIGHGNRSFEEFVALLRGSSIGCLIDVRAFPGSRRHPHFGRGELERSLPGVDIDYVWEGTSLGGRRRPRTGSPHVALRHPSFRAYADHMESAEFGEGVQRVLDRAERVPVAIMCAERLPWQCHRYMISDYLVAHGVEVRHLMDTGKPRSHAVRAEARVLDGKLVYDANTQAGLSLD